MQLLIKFIIIYLIKFVEYVIFFVYDYLNIF